MTTVDLLRDVLREDADAAAEPRSLAAVRTRVLDAPGSTGRQPAFVVTATASGRRRVRPAAVGLGALAATVVAALTVALFVAGRPGAGTAPAAVAPAAALSVTTYGFGVDADPGGWPFEYSGTATGVQGGVWRAGGGATPVPAVLDVLTGAGETAVPARPPDARSVTVGGAPGWSARVDAVDVRLFYSLDPADTLTVWRDDATGLWAALLTAGLPADRVAELAATVRLGDYHPVRTPVTLRWLPPGVALSAASAAQGQVSLQFGTGSAALTLAVGPAGTQRAAGGTADATPTPVAVAGWSGSYRSDDPFTRVTDGRVDVVVGFGPGQRTAPGSPTAAMPRADLDRLLAGLTVADLDDAASWPALADALPRS